MEFDSRHQDYSARYWNIPNRKTGCAITHNKHLCPIVHFPLTSQVYGTGVIKNVMRLSYDGNQLLDEKTFESYGIKGGTIQVFYYLPAH